MSLFPIFLKLQGEPALVVGGGALAQPKIEALLRSGAALRVVAPRASREISDWAQNGRVRWQPRDFQPGDVHGNRLVFAATGIRSVDRAVAEECRRQGVLCNAIDDPPYCAFYSPAVVQRGDLQLAISTNGQSPALAQQVASDALMSAQADRHDAASKAPARRFALRQVFDRLMDAGMRWLSEEDDKVALI